jgi:glycosyltransferase involved in cell wall biosynthesis
LVPPIRVVSIVEAWFVTGQAKNLLEFGKRSRVEEAGIQPVNLSLVTYERGAGAGDKNQFVIAAREAQIPLDLITEKGRFDFSALTQIKKIVAERRPHVIQTHNVKSHFLLRISGLWRTHRWIAFHHGYTTTDFKMQCYNQLDRWSLRVPDRVVTVCGAFAHDLENRGVAPGKIIVRHNSVRPYTAADPASLAAVRQTVPAGIPVLLVVGRLSQEKGHLDLLAALNILRRKLKEERFHVILVGDGPEQAKIEAARRDLALEDHVTMAGLRHDVRPYYGIADVVVMPSHSEGSPNVLLEAMAAGIPVVATRAGGIPEIATDSETALLVPSRDPTAMAFALQKILHDTVLRETLARNAREVAEKQYSPDAHRRSLVQIYQNVLADSGNQAPFHPGPS